MIPVEPGGKGPQGKMAEAAQPGIGTHFVRYTIGSVLIMAAGFVSYPIMARLLDYHQFGLIGVFDSALLLMTAVFKLGGQFSTLRFYPHRGSEGAIARYGANYVLLPFLGSCALWLLAVVTFASMPRFESYASEATGWIALFTLLPTIWISIVTNVMMAEERSDLNVLFNVGYRWLSVFAILGIVYFFSRTALGVYFARLLVVLVTAAWLTIWLLKRGIPMRWRDRDKASLLAGMRYGMPLMANEISTILLVSVDRFMLEGMSGSIALVGVYTVGAALATQVSTMLHSALNTSYNQLSIRLFETEGVKAVLQTKKAILHLLVYVVVATLVGLASVGKDAFLFLSGPSKAESVPIFLWLCAIFVLNGMFHMCAAGLQLYKRSMTVFVITLVGALVNIGFNYLLIPRFGVFGAVFATIGSYIVIMVARLIACPAEIFALPTIRPTATACALGLLCWLIARFTNLFHAQSHLIRLLVMLAIMVLFYALPALFLDRRLRATAVEQWSKLRVRFA